MHDIMKVSGRYEFIFYDANGVETCRDTIDNLTTDVGANYALDTYLAGSSFTVTGPFMFLISSTSYTAINASDTMSSHSTWLEAGATNTPHYSGNRKTCAWNSASARSKVLSSALTFNFTGSGTVKGAGLVLGSGAVNTIDDTNGTLYSAGLFTGGDKIVANGDSVSVSFTATLT